LLFNIIDLLGIGDFNLEDDYIFTYSEGSGRLGIILSVDYQEGSSPGGITRRFIGTLTLYTTSDENVQNIGISYVYYFILINNGASKFNERDLNPPITSYSIDYTFYLDKGDNITCEGVAIAKFNVQGIIQNETVNYDISILVPMSPSEITYQLGYPIIWLEVLDIAFIIALIYAIVRFGKSIKHDLKYTEEMRKKDEKFFRYIKEKEGEPENFDSRLISDLKKED